MARTRDMIRDLFRLMPEEAQEASFPLGGHDCAEFRKHGSCLLCYSTMSNLQLAYLAIARKFNLLGPELLNTERVLLDIVGPTKYNNMLREQIRSFVSGPSMSCPSCDAKVKMYMPYTQAFQRLRTIGQQRVHCGACGAPAIFTVDNVKPPKGMTADLRNVDIVEELQRFRPQRRPRVVRVQTGRAPTGRAPTMVENPAERPVTETREPTVEPERRVEFPDWLAYANENMNNATQINNTTWTVT